MYTFLDIYIFIFGYFCIGILFVFLIFRCILFIPCISIELFAGVGGLLMAFVFDIIIASPPCQYLFNQLNYNAYKLIRNLKKQTILTY
ncbi:hypothetical protein Q765_15060 [Flavobacterium rivuli WB 3.3-2 = DSM 21788]|uniref:Uncharacterized protein n=1 Tax=Flavobacterium rivuli WB 3.3-2 = DSM 21788 TaxID=1121895 RepID=A0A0A2MBT6_9FLAO|nr:hypothetical protein Q765_15060 [Flavobacterium rivuli WB 3.3-2 = DSM 21788]